MKFFYFSQFDVNLPSNFTNNLYYRNYLNVYLLSLNAVYLISRLYLLAFKVFFVNFICMIFEIALLNVELFVHLKEPDRFCEVLKIIEDKSSDCKTVEDCSICHDDIVEGRKLNCLHCFHASQSK